MADTKPNKKPWSVEEMVHEDTNKLPPLLLVTVDSMLKELFPPPSPVCSKEKGSLLLPWKLVACSLALLTAFALGIAAGISLIASPCDLAKSSWLVPCIEMTDAVSDKVEAFQRRQLWISGVQATAALLGLLITGRRQALGFIALVVGVVNLYMVAVVASLFIAAAPGNLSNKIGNDASVVIVAVLELLGFVALIMGRHDQ